MNNLVKAHNHIKKEHCTREFSRSIILAGFIVKEDFLLEIYSFHLNV